MSSFCQAVGCHKANAFLRIICNISIRNNFSGGIFICRGVWGVQSVRSMSESLKRPVNGCTQASYNQFRGYYHRQNAEELLFWEGINCKIKNNNKSKLSLVARNVKALTTTNVPLLWLLFQGEMPWQWAKGQSVCDAKMGVGQSGFLKLEKDAEWHRVVQRG